MDSKPSTSRDCSHKCNRANKVEAELIYLIAKYLSVGPCKKSYEVLKAEIDENKILPNRTDWLGNEHGRTFNEYDSQHGHIAHDFLLCLVSRLEPTIQQLCPTFPQIKSSILGIGTQSCLRTDKDLTRSYRTTVDAIPRRWSNPGIEQLAFRGEVPNVVHALTAREINGSTNKKHFLTNKFYSRLQQFDRNVGHLSAVYCMLFDRTGRYIVTGADDALVKIWSTRDGRLEATLRGASAEISDLALDHDNQLIAAGSCDKVIRVWSLQTLAPVAVLTSHTGMITALQFCPAPGKEGVLVSTGGDGCVAFWTYTKNRTGAKFDPKPLKLNERVRPGHAQLICASFSTGGRFLVVGGADHIVRVYRLGGEHGVEKLIESEIHKDRVDSIQWCHKGVGFVSGSRDGTALVWRYECQLWKTTTLRMDQTLPYFPPFTEESKALQVTMVGWDRTDTLVVTASSDHLLRVWDSHTGELKKVLEGHEDNAYVIEAHPTEDRIVLTAGHDGLLFIWDVISGAVIKSFKNTIEGQGHGALFDAKWAPDGLSVATTDSHGHIIIFGIGNNEIFKKIPQELFFHTDYRPLVRDVNHHVLDEQTQLAPHLMPPPFLVNIEGDPYPPEVQRLVPGRGNCRMDQLIPNVVTNDNGEQEVLDLAIADVEPPRLADVEPPRLADVEPPRLADVEPPRLADVEPPRLADVEPPRLPAEGAAEQLEDPSARPNIDDMIERLAQEQQEIRASHRGIDDEPGPSGLGGASARRVSLSGASGGPHPDHSYAVASGASDPLSPRTGRVVGARREGDIEGVRQSRGNWQRDPDMKWKRRLFLAPLTPETLENSSTLRAAHGDLEIQLYEEEGRKRPQIPVSKAGDEEKEERTTRRYRRRQKKTHAYSTRASRGPQSSRRGGPGASRSPRADESAPGNSRPPGTPHVPRAQMAFGADFEDPDSVIPSHDDEDAEVSSSSTSSSSSASSAGVKDALEDVSSSSSEEDSTDYSDWTADVEGAGLEPPKRTAHKQKNAVPVRRRKKKLKEEEEEEESDDETKDKGKKRERRKRGDKEEEGEKRPSNARRRKDARGLNLAESDGEGGIMSEIPPAYRPPEWLSETVPKKAPYFPQMGDEIMYFRQGHQLYVEAVISRGLYVVDKRSLPWIRKHNLRDQECVKIIGMKYEIKPPRLCCLKLGIMEGEVLTGDSFTIKYHDLPDVLDFLVLKSSYDTAVSRNWKSGDNFRCIIDDAWWLGTVEAQDPHLPEFPDSMFMCYRVLWDNGERERLSPWDMEPIDEQVALPDVGGSLKVCPEEYKTLVYTPSPEEWPPPSFESECRRMAEGIGKIMELSAAEPFSAPVDLNVYPNYALIVEYPMDLSTIKSRLESHFYRRPNAAQFDARYIATNAEKFNKKGSVIVRNARVVTDLALRLIKDPTCRDPTVFYHEVQANYQSPNHSEEEEEGARKRPVGRPRGSASSSKREATPVTPKGDTRPWQQQCRDLLKSMFERQDSIPFRFPVDLERYKDYNQVIDVPMDLSTIREELAAGGYSSPLDFAKDVRLVFSNSKNYNTNNKSRIYSMTVRLEAFFEDQIKGIFARCKNKGKGKGPVPLQRGARKPRGIPNSTKANLPLAGTPTQPSLTSTSRPFTSRISRGGISCQKEWQKKTSRETSPIAGPSRGHASDSRMNGSLVSGTSGPSDNEDEGLRGSVNEGGMRRSRRVAQLRQVQNFDSDSDDEDYSPVKRSPQKPPPRGLHTTHSGKPSRSRKSNSPPCGERRGGKGGPIKRSTGKKCEQDSDFEVELHQSTSSKRIRSYEVDSDFEVGLSLGNKKVKAPEWKRRRTQTKKASVEEDTEDEEEDVTTVTIEEEWLDEEIERKTNGGPTSFRGKRRIESSEDEDQWNSLVNGIQKDEEEGKQEEESEDEDSDEVDSSYSPLPRKFTLASFGSRKKREESEVEFDEDELEESEEDDEEEDKKRKGGNKGQKKGVGAGVRRARRKVLDREEDDDDLVGDEGYMADDRNFIDDDDVTSSEEDEESEDSDEDSDDFRRRKRKKKPRKMTAKERAKKKAQARQKKIKQAKAMAKAKAKIKEAKEKAKAKLEKQRAREKAKEAKKRAKIAAAAASPKKPRGGRKKKSAPTLPSLPSITPTASVTIPLHLSSPQSSPQSSVHPVSYQPLGLNPRTHMTQDVVMEGKVIGRVFTRIDEASTSSFSEGDQSMSFNAPNGAWEGSGSEEDEGGRRGRVRKRVRYNEDSDDGDIPSVSSRGRVRKANTRMRDFI